MSTIDTNLRSDPTEKPDKSEKDNDGIGKAASGLEAYMLRELMSTVRESTSGGLDSGFAGGTFREMLDGALTDKMAEGGGLGLRSLIEKSLDQAKDKGKSADVKAASTATNVDTIAAQRALQVRK